MDIILTLREDYILSQGVFEYETDMIDVLSSSYPSQYFYGKRQYRKISQIPEVTVGSVIPDIVCIALPKTFQEDCSHYHPEIDTLIMFDLLRYGPSTTKEISGRIYARTTTIKESLGRLCNKSTVAFIKPNQYKLMRKTVLYDYHIVSIEAKLKDWRTALKQATTYRSFSHISYIALPETIATKRIVRENCQAEMIGLISVQKNSTNILFKPRPHPPFSSKWIWLLSKTVGIM